MDTTHRDVIIACDFSSAAETLAFLDKFTGSFTRGKLTPFVPCSCLHSPWYFTLLPATPA